MGIRCCCSLRSFFVAIFILIYSIWLLKLFIRDSRPDYRVEMLGLLNTEPFQSIPGELYLRKIQTSLKMENFELIQMMNETTPNEINEEAILVISASHSGVDNTYAHYLQMIQKSNQNTRQLPFYLLRKAKNIFLQNPKTIKLQAQEIASVLDYFTNFLLVKKLTVLSFEEGSLLTLKSLTITPYNTFSIINKLILINPFNPTIMICHSNSASFVEQIKANILKDEVRTQLINDTRIIMINTVNTDMGEGKINWFFYNQAGEKITFAKSIIVSSRFMWNVYCFLKPYEYFKFQPFLWIITKLFNEDRTHGPLQMQALKNLLLYRELPVPLELSPKSKKNIIPLCVDFHLENYKYDGDILNAQCIRFLRKQNYFFNENTTIIIKASGRFQVYGEMHEKLNPFDTKNKDTIYVLENILEFRRFFVINKRRYHIQILIQSTHRPLDKDMLQSWKNDTIEEIFTLQPKRNSFGSLIRPVLLCPGYLLLYPYNFISIYRPFGQQLGLETSDIQKGCFSGYDYFFSWVQKISQNWNLGVNLIFFTLFCSHVLKQSTFSRYYAQFFLNTLLVYLHTEEYLFAENLMILSLVVIIEIFMKLTTSLSDMMAIPKNISSKVMWIPLVFEILRQYDANGSISPWKIIGIQFLIATYQNNVIILFLEFSFIIEEVARDMPNFQGLFLICAWLTVTAMQQQEQKIEKEEHNLIIITTGKRLKSLKSLFIKMRKQIVDTLTVCIIALCLTEDGSLMHYIVDFYIIAHVLFAMHHYLDEYI